MICYQIRCTVKFHITAPVGCGHWSSLIHCYLFELHYPICPETVVNAQYHYESMMMFIHIKCINDDVWCIRDSILVLTAVDTLNMKIVQPLK